MSRCGWPVSWHHLNILSVFSIMQLSSPSSADRSRQCLRQYVQNNDHHATNRAETLNILLIWINALHFFGNKSCTSLATRSIARLRIFFLLWIYTHGQVQKHVFFAGNLWLVEATFQWLQFKSLFTHAGVNSTRSHKIIFYWRQKLRLNCIHNLGWTGISIWFRWCINHCFKELELNSDN